MRWFLVGLALVLGGVAVASVPAPPVDPAPIAWAAENQMLAVLVVAVVPLLFGIVAMVGFRYAWRFLGG